MSLTRRLSSVLFVVLALTVMADAQLFTDQGTMSGSGLMILPTATLSPVTEFQLHFSRIGYTKGGGTGLNVITLGAGLSESLEGYVRLTGEQLGTYSSQVAYGFGGKFRLPLLLPVVRRLALWMDVTTSDQVQRSAIFPSEAKRMGVTATFDSNGVHPTMLIGISTTYRKTQPLLGAGVTIAASQSTQIGFEIIHGYLGKNSAQLGATVSQRILSNVSMHFSPGYLSVGGVSTATAMIGISCSTADINFHPAFEQKKGEEFILPSIEEIERQQKSSSGSSMLQGSQSPDSLEAAIPIHTTSPKEAISKNSSAKGVSQDNSSIDNKKSQELKKEENQKP